MILRYLLKIGLMAAALMLYSAAPAAAQANDAGNFIDQVIEAYGGRQYPMDPG